MEPIVTIENPPNPNQKPEAGSIELLQNQTKTSVLDAFYRDESVFGRVVSILTGKRVNPSDLINNLENVRSQLREAQNDEVFKKAA